jgi:hypothetical protein
MSGGFNPISAVSQIALGIATGGTSLFAQIAMQIASQVVKEVVSQVAQDFGLPPQLADQLGSMASGGLTGNSGLSANDMLSQAAGDAGASSVEHAQMQGQIDDLRSTLNQALSQGMLENTKENSGVGGGHGSGGSWLLAMAEALGDKLNAKADQMQQDADSISDSDPKATAIFSAESQQFSILMNATTNAIKTIGEALANTASKN